MNEQEEFEFRARAEREGQQKPSFMKQAWGALAKPEQMSREGLQKLASFIPEGKITGNMPADLARGTPRILANTMAQAAPSFISRGSLLGMGAGKALGAAAPAANALRKGLFSQLESASGSVPQSLEAAYQDPSLMFAKGKEAAGPLYKAAKTEMAGDSIFKGMYRPDQIVDAAKEYLSKGGKLEPTEALMYRKALDKLLSKGSVIKDELIPLREEADAAAKASDKIAMADPMYKRGLQAQSLRNFLPQNKYGGASAFKMGIAPALSGLGGFVGGPPGAAVGGAMAAGALSPAVQGAGATGLGVANRAISPLLQNPKIASIIAAVLERLRSQQGQ